VSIDEVFPRNGADLYERALQLDPSLSKAKVNLGNCHFRLGNRDVAEACWVQACEEGEHCAFFNLGWLRQQEGRLDEAIALFMRTNDLDPSFPDAYYHLGLALEKIGKTARAKAALRTYLKLEPRGPSLLNETARLKLERLP
jgi:tetratricopeptide (TPR) repeat protein